MEKARSGAESFLDAGDAGDAGSREVHSSSPSTSLCGRKHGPTTSLGGNIALLIDWFQAPTTLTLVHCPPSNLTRPIQYLPEANSNGNTVDHACHTAVKKRLLPLRSRNVKRQLESVMTIFRFLHPSPAYGPVQALHARYSSSLCVVPDMRTQHKANPTMARLNFCEPPP